ncbi:plasmid stabilization protein [Nocardia sp. NPDC004278]
MPKAWSDKRERQFEHIKDAENEQGVSSRRAEEIAARTVNKNRAQSGEAATASRSSVQDMSPQRRGGLRSGTNRRKGPTRDQLYNEAKKRKIEGRSKMSKGQLARALGRD